MGWVAERKRCGSADRKPGPEASRVNGRLSDCMSQTWIDKNDRLRGLHLITASLVYAWSVLWSSNAALFSRQFGEIDFGPSGFPIFGAGIFDLSGSGLITRIDNA